MPADGQECLQGAQNSLESAGYRNCRRMSYFLMRKSDAQVFIRAFFNAQELDTRVFVHKLFNLNS